MTDYTLQYVYQLTDFDTTGTNDAVPDESGALASGTPPFQLQLDVSASPQQITVTDPDDELGEISNTGQVLTNDVTIDGVTYPAGSSILINYVITTDDGFEGYSITIDAGNTGGNTTTAFLTNSPMTPGEVYTFTSEGNIGNDSRPYTQFACFMNGTLIGTKDGAVSIENLRDGQLLTTFDGGYAPLQLMLRRKLFKDDFEAFPNLRPIRIVEGALGNGLPKRDLLVSPQHRIMVSSPITKRMFDAERVLVSAKKLLEIPGIFVDTSINELEYFHLVLEKHEVIFAEGAPTESFYCGEVAIAGLSQYQRIELFQLFPELEIKNSKAVAALPIPAGKLQLKLAMRHRKNNKALVGY